VKTSNFTYIGVHCPEEEAWDAQMEELLPWLWAHHSATIPSNINNTTAGQLSPQETKLLCCFNKGNDLQ
jgi:hypothetical protein